MNCERERQKPHDEDGRLLPALSARPVSAWSYLLSPEMKTKHSNPRYQPALDDRDPKRKGTDMGVLIADSRDVRYFEQLFRRASGDMNAALDKEADERRRARERLERAVRGTDAASLSSEALRPAAVDGNAVEGQSVPVAGGGELEKAEAAIAVVGPGDPDPVLDPLASAATGATKATQNNIASPAPGAVDLGSNGQIDQTILSYQARQPRNRVQQNVGASASSASLASTDSSAALANNVSNAADAAANRMKNLFIGGWGRLQEAMAAPPSASSPLAPDSAQSAYRPASPAKAARDPEARPTSLPSSDHDPLGLNGAQRSQAHTSSTATAPISAVPNPWAANAAMRAEMQREHVAMRTPFGSTGGGNMSTQRPGFGAQERRESWRGASPHRSGDIQKQSETDPKTEGKQSSSTAMTSDPLGVL